MTITFLISEFVSETSDEIARPVCDIGGKAVHGEALRHRR